MSLLLNDCKLPSIYDNNKPKIFTSSLFLINNNKNENINNNIIISSKSTINSIINSNTSTNTSSSHIFYNNNNNNNNNYNGNNKLLFYNENDDIYENNIINNDNKINSFNYNNNIDNINNDFNNNNNINNNNNNNSNHFKINNLFTDNNFDNKKSKKLNKKKDPFNIYQVSNSFCLEVCGVSYDTLIFLWTFIKNNNPPFEANSYQLVWALNWLKEYTQVREGASKWSVGKDLFQKAINNIISFLGSQLNTISLNERHIGTNNSNIKLVIDILFVETQKPSDKETQNLLYSKKHQKYGYKFECCVRSNDGLICWFKGPYPGSTQLLSILDSSHLLQSIDEDEKILAKSDYIGISKKFEFPLKESHLDRLNIDELLNYEQQITYCHILDNTLSFMKKFRFCSDRIRTKGSILEYGIRLIANIHNLELENKPPIQCLKKKKLFI